MKKVNSANHAKLTRLHQAIEALEFPETHTHFFRKEVDFLIDDAMVRIIEARKLIFQAYLMELEDEEKRGWTS